MAEIINLRRARKARQRTAAENEAAGNRTRFGRTKGQRAIEAAENARIAALIDGAKCEPE